MATLKLRLLGDFYEAFDADAEILAKTLGITLTKERGTGRPMCGFMKWNLHDYSADLREAGIAVEVV